ncbi:AbiJ-NTD4 domain-containing protein [Burkholderia ambifaria]|uniref:AbiJ-NTD4 domain-containing protein n=1 Tax=Burkholderia ambifaria TaxID=152480 RepID=UPI001FC819B7|nr:hypothetical protein [Burkholderia ambifaria]
MSLRFSQRLGITPLPETLKPEAMPDSLRNLLWNQFLAWQQHQPEDQLLHRIYTGFWKKPSDTIPVLHTYGGRSCSDAWAAVRAHFFQVQWHGVYDFLEFLIGLGYPGQRLGESIDVVLAQELAAYRVINQQIVGVTTPQEIEAVQDALALNDAFAPVSAHLSTAIAHFSNRQNPDYRNSIKESISAVEAAARVVCGDDKATLGAALGILGKQGRLHSALKSAYSSLYGYTNDADGIRHALMDEPNLTADDAKYFLITCTAFVNYLKTLV